MRILNVMNKKIKILLISLILVLISLTGVLLFFIQKKPKSTSKINCQEEIEYFLSKNPDFFRDVAQGVEWCNQCLKSNGMPTLSYDAGPFCNLKTSDAHKSCTDSSQCEGICLAENEISKSGRCSDRKLVLGCIFEMTNRESVEICFD